MDNSTNFRLNENANQTSYISGRYHELLSLNAGALSGPNIGNLGENLTISFLSLNRSTLSLRLMRSLQQHIPYFKGELLIIDNGSEITEINKLKEECAKMPYKCRIVELRKNYGVAGGRNRTMQHVQKDWVMCLDNDIYFIDNPLPKIQKDISRLGCHFLNLPLLDENGVKTFAFGGHLYLDCNQGDVFVGGGSAYTQTGYSNVDMQGFLSTFLFGGASVLNKHTFCQAGGYDEEMFIGFEDTDFSIKLFRDGLKIGNLGAFFLIHAHEKPLNITDKDYERNRFSREIIKKSAEYFENKHGMRVWSQGVDDWLKERRAQLEIEVDTKAEMSAYAVQTVDQVAKNLPKIALITDTDNWAFANIARQLIRYLSDRFEFEMIPMSVIDNINQVLLMTRDCDIVHFFWREHITLIGTKYYKAYIEDMGISYEQFKEKVLKNLKVSTCIYDHLLLDDENLVSRRHLYENLITNYYVSSERLYEIYSNIEGYPMPAAILEDGVDLTLFYPINLERFRDIKYREIVLGWAGNSNWSADIEDFKGVHTILKPAVEQLLAEGYPVRTFFADRAERMIPHEHMVDYYSKIDIYICTSKVEGTPNPVLEAMACGIPIISTDVGIVPQAFGKKQSEFILKERAIEHLKNAIKKLIANSNLFLELSKENLEQIKEWDWAIKAQKFTDYFNRCLEKKKI